MAELEIIRKKYPRFVYDSYNWKIQKKGLKITFSFKIEHNINFEPIVFLQNITASQVRRVGEEPLDNLVFNLGLIEMLSYWKATCSPEIIIKAGRLYKQQIVWWQKIIEKGMAQFFYENKINFRGAGFLKIKTVGARPLADSCYEKKLAQNEVLVPVGGGKDSIVTLEMLKKSREKIRCFFLNPGLPSKKIGKLAGCKKPIIVERKIDPKLLALNKKGFLNGHTPFSAYLAFLSSLVAVLADIGRIAFSNEKSADEGNLTYLGATVNHQWSKSYEFETLFRQYSQKYLARDINYFSLLRPLYELQISKIFSQYPKYFPVFLSCNQKKPKNQNLKSRISASAWCGKCPKCLSTFILLAPFVSREQLTRIFGQNLFTKKELLPLMLQLIGERGFKPFECVGTKKEILIALYLSWEKYKGQTPLLLKYFEKRVLPKYPNLTNETKNILNFYDKNNFLPKNLTTILRDEISSV